jgi:hypothetical protein
MEQKLTVTAPKNKDGIAARIRHHLLKNGLQTVEDIQDAINEPNRQRVMDNIKYAVQSGFAERKRDEITNLPAYRLTPKGTGRAKMDANNFNGKTADQNVSESKARDQAAMPDDLPEDDDDAMPEPDADLLASANRMLSERLEGVAHVLRGSGLEGLKDCDGSEDLQPRAAALAGAYQMLLKRLDGYVSKVNEIGAALGVYHEEYGSSFDAIAEAIEAMRLAIEGQDRLIKELKHEIKNHEAASRLLLEKNTNLMETLADLRQPVKLAIASDGPTRASAKQVGGNHYAKLAIQPMQYSMANGLDPLQHTAIKYVTRFRDKDGIQDLEKAKHCIDLLIEHELETEAA